MRHLDHSKTRLSVCVRVRLSSMERTRRSHPHSGEEEIREVDDRWGMAQFDFFEQQNIPPPGTGQLSDAASPALPDLNLSLSSGGQVSSNSLPVSLAINERAPPPPRDFLSLSRSGALPLPTGPGHQQQQVPLVEYQNRRNDESSQRRLLEQMKARERPILPSPQQHLSVPLIQQQARAGRPAQQPQSRQVVFPTKILPHQQVSTGQHHQQQAVTVPPEPVQRQTQHRLSVVSASQGPPPSSVAAEIKTVIKSGAFSRAINYIRTALSSGTINIPAEEGSSNCTSAQTDSALTDQDRGKQPLVPRSETAPPLNMSSSGSGGTVPVEVPGPESMAKRMRLMRAKGSEDGVQKVMSKTLGEAFKVGRDLEERMTEGFLYRHPTGEVSIVCSCHGIFLTSAEFLEHAGRADAENPRKRITISSNPVPNF